MPRPLPIPPLLLVAVLLLVGCRPVDSDGQARKDPTPDNRTGTTMSHLDPTDRTPAWIREHGNRLAGEPSLYLRQHANNPLDWYPWSEEALETARRQDKLVFLSIGYSSCHWCHVMEHEVFEDDAVAAFMNEHFVCIKVDREERPDLDSVYMDAVQLMTGRGGWPMSVFLTPELKPFHGGTYFPRDHFMKLVERIVEIRRDDRKGLEEQAEQVAARIASGASSLIGLEPGEEDGAIGRAMIDDAVQRAKQSYDAANGGFSQQQKFPTPAKWRFLLHEFRNNGRRGDGDELCEMIEQTCEAIARGGLYDHVGGGFHRYTVDENWTVPHFEKMLYDNGQLAGLLLEAGVALNRDDFAETARDALDFLLREMSSPEGAFYASFDADSGGEEGTYYVWSRDEIAEIAGESDGPVLADLLGVTAEGNFENTGKSVLTRRADMEGIAARSGRDARELRALFAGYRDLLRARRDNRTAPGLDRKVVTSWNALTVTALAQAHAATGEERYLDAARRAADFLLAEHRDEAGRLVRASTDGAKRGDGILDDYSFLAEALLALYQVTGEAKYLRAARELVDLAIVEFGRDGGGYFLSGQSADAPLGRSADVFDSVEPSGASMMVSALVQLAAITGETKYRDRAQLDLEAHAALLDRAGLEMAWWLDAALKLTNPYFDVVVAGDPDDEATKALRRAALESLPPNAVLSLVPANGPDDDLLALAPALQGKTALEGRPVAYVCEFGLCREPARYPDMLRSQLTSSSVK